MCLNDLIDNGQTESRTAFELRLERLEYLLDHLRTHTGAGVGEAQLPLVFHLLNADRERATFFHRPDCVLAEVPEDLLHSVSIGKDLSFLSRIGALDFDAGVLCLHAMLKKSQRVFE